MMDLILHIGLPKTGSTSIQRVLQDCHPNYHGKRHSDRGSEMPSDFHRFFVRNGGLVRHDSSAWRDRLLRWWKRASQQGQQDVLVSDETLTAWPTQAPDGSFEYWPVAVGDDQADPREGMHPVIDFVRDVGLTLEGRARVRVVIVLRSQPDLIGSLFAELSGSRRRASQADLDTTIARLTTLGDPFLDYHALVAGLIGAIGRGNLSLHLFEDGLEHVVEQMSEFIGIPYAAAMREEALPVLNRRSSAQGVWQLRTRSRTMQFVRRYRRLGQRIPPAIRHQVFRNLKRLERGFAINAAPEEVALSLIQRERVLESVAPSNARLEETLGRDLRGAGYLL